MTEPRPTRDWPEAERAAWYDAHREEVEAWPELPPFVDDGRWEPCICRHPHSFHKQGPCVGRSCDCEGFTIDAEADDRRKALDELAAESHRLGLDR